MNGACGHNQYHYGVIHNGPAAGSMFGGAHHKSHCHSEISLVICTKNSQVPTLTYTASIQYHPSMVSSSSYWYITMETVWQ